MKTRKLICPVPKKLEWREEDVADSPGDGEVLIRSRFCALKHGTEWHRIRNSGPFAQGSFDGNLRLFDRTAPGNEYPCAIGNMTVGDIEVVGKNVHQLEVGQPVFGALPAADIHICKVSRVRPLGKLTADQAMSIDPAMFGIGGVIDGNVMGGRVLITGAGAIGLFAVQEAKARGATVIASSSMPHRRQLAKAFGADEVIDSSGQKDIALKLKNHDHEMGREGQDCGVDVAIECSGKYHNLRHAIRATRQCGRVVTIGFYDGGADNINFGEEIFHNRLTIIASLPAFRWRNPLRTAPPMFAPELHDLVADYLQDGRLRTDGMFTYVPMGDAIATIQRTIDDPGEIVKLVIEFRI